MLPDVLLNKGIHQCTHLLIILASFLMHKKISMKNILQTKNQEFQSQYPGEKWEEKVLAAN